MDSVLFDINSFNIIEDKDNYYFFRALNMADNYDIAQKITVFEDGKIKRIRTDRERYIGDTKYKENSVISLEEVYDHIKNNYRKDTNCISLTSNANVAVKYGRGAYKDKYVMIKIPKSKFEKKVIVAGQYMIQELDRIIQRKIEKLLEYKKNKILSIFENIDSVTENNELKKIITKRYTAKNKLLHLNNVHRDEKIKCFAPKSRVCNYQVLNKKQLLEINKLYAKLAILENEDILKNVIPHVSNFELRATIERAYSSVEVIHYGEISNENIIEVTKEVVDLFALIQQVNNIDKNLIKKLEEALLVAIQNGKKIRQVPDINFNIRDNISMKEVYRTTNGKIEYDKAKNIIKKLFYLGKSRKNAIILSNILEEVLDKKLEFKDCIEYIRKNGFRIEPEIVSIQNGNGVKLSESVNLDLTNEEKFLIDRIKSFSIEELDCIIEKSGLYNVWNVM